MSHSYRNALPLSSVIPATEVSRTLTREIDQSPQVMTLSKEDHANHACLQQSGITPVFRLWCSLASERQWNLNGTGTQQVFII